MIFVFDQFLVGLGMKEGMAAVSKLGGGLRHIHNFQQRPELGHHQLRTRLAHAWLQISEVFTTVTTSIRSCNATLRSVRARRLIGCLGLLSFIYYYPGGSCFFLRYDFLRFVA